MIRFIKKLWGSSTVRFVLSSLLAFIVDYVLLLLLFTLITYFYEHRLPDYHVLFGGGNGGNAGRAGVLEVSAVLAWCVSSSLNFVVNRHFVFRSEGPVKKELLQYYSLALPVFLIKTFALLEVLARVLNVPVEYAKPIAETIFFIINYIVQRFIIFKKKRTAAPADPSLPDETSGTESDGSERP